jgi:hypothetical protein
MLRAWFSACLCLLLIACTQQPAAPSAAMQTSNDAQRSGAVSDATAEPPPPPPEEQPDEPHVVDWRPRELTDGWAWISCESDYAAAGEGEPLESLGFTAMRRAMLPCQEAGVLRLRYRGKISADFTALVERAAEMADTLGIERRILDLDSSGGLIGEAIEAGDIIGESGWTIWVREDSICHSSCVLVLAAGDNRLIAGKVGIHRMVRLNSEATSRAELNQELQEVAVQVRQYLARNGAAFAIVDLMMTVPNRSLRLLTDEELDLFGLDGRNAVEDDLQRIQLARKCGESFVRRKDAFFRAFDSECKAPDAPVEDMGACGMALRERFGFPDPECPAESPMAEYDGSNLEDLGYRFGLLRGGRAS